MAVYLYEAMVKSAGLSARGSVFDQKCRADLGPFLAEPRRRLLDSMARIE